ncbi:MAG: hypothetical protein ED557_11040 [Balneola sp.]|nr:MAG: hypothetical protein ED557_11040 [Balneola sp.]
MLVDGLEGRWESGNQRWTFVNDIRNVPDITINGENYEGTIGIEAEEDDVFIEGPFYMIIFEELSSSVPDTSYFLGAAGQIGNNLFLDLQLFDFDMRDDNFVDAHLFRVHTFSRLTLNQDKLSIELFEDSWITDLIVENRVRIKHEKINDTLAGESEILITASTKELQRFVKKYGDDEDAFDDPIELTRVNNEL